MVYNYTTPLSEKDAMRYFFQETNLFSKSLTIENEGNKVTLLTAKTDLFALARNSASHEVFSNNLSSNTLKDISNTSIINGGFDRFFSAEGLKKPYSNFILFVDTLIDEKHDGIRKPSFVISSTPQDLNFFTDDIINHHLNKQGIITSRTSISNPSISPLYAHVGVNGNYSTVNIENLNSAICAKDLITNIISKLSKDNETSTNEIDN